MRCLIAVCALISLCVPPAAAESPTPDRTAVVLSGSWGSVWYSGPTAKLRPDTTVPSARQATVSISAAGNEFEPFQLALRPSKLLKGVKVAPRTLTGPGGAKLPAWNISVRKVEYVRVAEPAYPGAAPGSYPDPLADLQPFSAPAGASSVLWVSVYVPDKTPAGDYSGTIDLTADGGFKAAVPLKLRVRGFSLPTVSRLRATVQSDYDGPVRFHGAATLEQKRRLVEVYNIDFWRHRVSPSRPYEFHDIKVQQDGEMLKLDFSDFDAAVQKFFARFNSFELPEFGVADSAGLQSGENKERLKIEYMRAVAEHLLNKGQLSKGYADILRGASPEQIQSPGKGIDLCERADGRIRVLLRGPQDAGTLKSADIWAAYVGLSLDEEMEMAQKNGAEVWLDASVSAGRLIESPAVNHRILPWMAWSKGLSGISVGDVMKWKEDRTAMLYPPSKEPSKAFADRPPVPSIRWELLREGIEDYDYFAILKDRVEKARQSDPEPPALAAAEEALTAAAQCAVSSTDFVRDPAKLQSVRERVATAIESLK